MLLTSAQTVFDIYISLAVPYIVMVPETYMSIMYVPNHVDFQYILLINNSTEHRPSCEARGLHGVKKFPAFYGTRMFITAFTRVHHLSLS
jgi:hypothetical protein